MLRPQRPLRSLRLNKHHGAKFARLLILLGAALALTVLTQIGGVVLLIAYGAAKWVGRPDRRRRWPVTVALFAGLYAGTISLVLQPLAQLGGRVALPCFGDANGNYRAGHWLFCALNRNFVSPPVRDALEALSAEMDRAFPGTVTLFLDAGFPVLDGFPLLPHLSHDDGRKLDLAYYYATSAGTYSPGRMKSSIGYFAFEQPRPGDPAPCGGRDNWLTMRWDLTWLQPLFPALVVEPERTRHALNWLISEGRRHGVEKVFVEPHLAARLGVAGPSVRFQGCRAARHDDHIHFQIDPDDLRRDELGSAAATFPFERPSHAALLP